jgi:hypothetical protein
MQAGETRTKVIAHGAVCVVVKTLVLPERVDLQRHSRIRPRSPPSAAMASYPPPASVTDYILSLTFAWSLICRRRATVRPHSVASKTSTSAILSALLPVRLRSRHRPAAVLSPRAEHQSMAGGR